MIRRRQVFHFPKKQAAPGELGLGSGGRRADDDVLCLGAECYSITLARASFVVRPAPMRDQLLGKLSTKKALRLRRALTGWQGVLTPNLDPDRVPSARMLGSELRENQSEEMPDH